MAEFKNFKEFFPYYLNEHRHRISRRLHFVGSSLVLVLLLVLIVSGEWSFWWTLPLAGYAFAWLGHFFFEKNRPATFRHPIYSLLGDWVMFFDILRGRVKL